jgi:hypothetical protein
MKKHIVLLFSLFACVLPAFAQMLPDSTFQVVAYWELGDKQQYQVESTKYNIVGTDTTVVSKSAGIYEFEVVAADEEKGYRIKVTSLESMDSDPIKEALDTKWRERLGGEVYYFETDPFGTFLQALPIEGLEQQQEALAQDVADAVLEKNPVVDREQLLPLIRQLLSPETLLAVVASEFAPLFLYHGSRFELGEAYPIEDEVPSVLGSGTMKMTGSFWVDENLTDDYSIVLWMYKEADKEQLKTFLASVVGDVAKTLVPNPEVGDEARAAIDEVFQDAKMSVEDLLSEEVHLGTGWPISWAFTREIHIEAEGQRQDQLLESSFNIIIKE